MHTREIGAKSRTGSNFRLLKTCVNSVIGPCGTSSSVSPSGAAAFTASMASRPAAPVRFSTIALRPSAVPSCSASSRPTPSTLPPAAKPSTMRTGGVWPEAGRAVVPSAASSAAAVLPPSR
jgi:hypothetical protein